MRKLLIALPLGIVGALLAIQLFYFIPSGSSAAERSCAFCNPTVLERQQYYEGKYVRVLLNYKPILTGHSLVIPKRHAPRFADLTTEEFTEMREVINKVQDAFKKVYGASDQLIVMQDGINAGQTEYHAHFHLLPRAEKNVVTKITIWWLMLMRPLQSWKSPDWPAIEAERIRLQEAMQSTDQRISATQRNPVLSLVSA